MAKNLKDFTVRINLDGWHIRGHGTCWVGQEYHGAEILPRMVDAIANGETFKFMGTRAPVCVLRGGSVEELKEAIGYTSAETEVKKPVNVETPIKEETQLSNDEEEDEEESESFYEDDDGELKNKSLKKKTPKRRPRNRE